MGPLTSRLRDAARTSLEVLSDFLFYAGLAGYAFLLMFLNSPQTIDHLFPNKFYPALLLPIALVLSFLGGSMLIPAGVIGAWRMRDLEPRSLRLLGCAVAIAISILGVMMVLTPMQILSRLDLPAIRNIQSYTASPSRYLLFQIADKGECPILQYQFKTSRRDPHEARTFHFGPECGRAAPSPPAKARCAPRSTAWA